MATGDQNQIEVLKNLRKQLAIAVRSIQWSYAIFWSSSSRQPGVLEWGDGYYNGDIKTRKTVQSVELNADQLGLQRSDQLRELYESLSLGETNPQAKRPTAALSPEDLTDAECPPTTVLHDNNIPEDGLDRLLDCPGMDINSPNDSSNEFADNLLRDGSNLLEGVDAEASQIQSWPFMDDAISNCLNNSANSSDCVSQTNGGRKSSFVGWRKDGPLKRAESGIKQKLLKKVLFEVAKMHENSRVEAGKNDNAEPRREVEEVDRNHVLSERKRREKINERDLERKVEELESFKESMEIDSTTQTKHQDAIERTSDNYGPNKIGNSKKPSTNKRKACEINKTGAENNITVSVIDRDVLIEMKCPWKDCVLVEIMECKGLRAPSVGVIRQALQKVIKKC
ncbi:transcription factor egl1 [Phtheirospermum japonicum]|uniref:Transcription factor egl1 n=1 Tax=Phtheirospermum japonicum TaxID=374723 RepID=A0A830DCT4_9LAMI|nr:transcription factor egl1 [Phtheirospermum japonicum]